MRNRYLVCYDISNPKRLQRTFKKMNGFGDPVQYSVFICSLSAKERVIMEEALIELINLKEDRIMIVDMGPAEGRGSECMYTIGKSSIIESRSAVVV